MNAEIELWLPAVGWDGLYEASDFGRIRSLDRFHQLPNGAMRSVRGRVLKPSPATRRRYQAVHLSRDGKAKSVSVHVLIAETFIGPRPGVLECCHGDGDKNNNRPGNLRWDTAVANQADSVRHGTAWNHNRPVRAYCGEGHELTEDNSYIRKDASGVKCMICKRDLARALYQKKNLSKGRVLCQ